METNRNEKNLKSTGHGRQRREFLKNGILYGTIAGVAGLSALTGCDEEAGEDISPAEDLMREHGLLNRILLIYDTCRLHLINGTDFHVETLHNSALIIRDFIEGYHEKLEEDFLFPRFLRQNTMIELIQALSIQHSVGRGLTGRIIQMTGGNDLAGPDDTMQLVTLLNKFNTMYRPHEAREDTVLFPEIRKIISKNEYYSLGEDFEKKEHELFGEDGFEVMVEKVADLEKQLDIYDLLKFNPQ